MKVRFRFGCGNIIYTEDIGNCYVYAYYDPRIEPIEIFYIGKGQGNRLRTHLTPSGLKYGHNDIKKNKIKAILKQNIEPIIVKIVDGLSEKRAYQVEHNLIEEFGTIINKNGPLTNIYIKDAYKNGNYKSNSGVSNFLERMNCEQRERWLNKYRRGKNNPSHGRKRTEKQMKAISELGKSWQGRKHKEETKIKMSQNSKGKNSGESNCNYGKTGVKHHSAKSLVIIFPDGEEILTKCIKEFAIAHNLQAQNLRAVERGKISNHKGFRAREYDEVKDKNIKIWDKHK